MPAARRFLAVLICAAVAFPEGVFAGFQGRNIPGLPPVRLAAPASVGVPSRRPLLSSELIQPLPQVYRMDDESARSAMDLDFAARFLGASEGGSVPPGGVEPTAPEPSSPSLEPAPARPPMRARAKKVDQFLQTALAIERLKRSRRRTWASGTVLAVGLAVASAAWPPLRSWTSYLGPAFGMPLGWGIGLSFHIGTKRRQLEAVTSELLEGVPTEDRPRALEDLRRGAATVSGALKAERLLSSLFSRQRDYDAAVPEGASERAERAARAQALLEGVLSGATVLEPQAFWRRLWSDVKPLNDFQREHAQRLDPETSGFRRAVADQVQAFFEHVVSGLGSEVPLRAARVAEIYRSSLAARRWERWRGVSLAGLTLLAVAATVAARWPAPMAAHALFIPMGLPFGGFLGASWFAYRARRRSKAVMAQILQGVSRADRPEEVRRVLESGATVSLAVSFMNLLDRLLPDWRTVAGVERLLDDAMSGAEELAPAALAAALSEWLEPTLAARVQDPQARNLREFLAALRPKPVERGPALGRLHRAKQSLDHKADHLQLATFIAFACIAMATVGVLFLGWGQGPDLDSGEGLFFCGVGLAGSLIYTIANGLSRARLSRRVDSLLKALEPELSAADRKERLAALAEEGATYRLAKSLEPAINAVLEDTWGSDRSMSEDEVRALGHVSGILNDVIAGRISPWNERSLAYNLFSDLDPLIDAYRERLWNYGPKQSLTAMAADSQAFNLKLRLVEKAAEARRERVTAVQRELRFLERQMAKVYDSAPRVDERRAHWIGARLEELSQLMNGDRVIVASVEPVAAVQHEQTYASGQLSKLRRRFLSDVEWIALAPNKAQKLKNEMATNVADAIGDMED